MTLSSAARAETGCSGLPTDPEAATAPISTRPSEARVRTAFVTDPVATPSRSASRMRGAAPSVSRTSRTRRASSPWVPKTRRQGASGERGSMNMTRRA
ncbi:MAG: hypothetical protein LKI24_04530 [Acidipropionibacterium sp.]|nr:hypothetical protein [Acidipropionibacterium sp.]